MKHKLKRLLSSVLAAATMFSTVAGALPQAAAFSAGDSVTLIFENDKQSCLKEKKGGTLVNLPIHECYAEENGAKYQSYCMDHGKHGIHEVSPSTNRHTYKLDAGSGYTQNPKAVGVSRWSTANTSPSTTTVPMSSSRLPMGKGSFFTSCRP